MRKQERMEHKQSGKRWISNTLAKFVNSTEVALYAHGASKQTESKIAYFNKKSRRYLFLFECQLN